MNDLNDAEIKIIMVIIFKKLVETYGEKTACEVCLNLAVMVILNFSTDTDKAIDSLKKCLEKNE
jgi:hypothetical protein